MAAITIRRYRNSDHDAVRLLFSEGNMEHVTAAYVFALKVPRVYIPLLLLFGCMLMVTGSYLLSVVGLVALLAVLWWALKSKYHEYVVLCLRDDLQDIEQSYMMKTNSCFWVVEAEGRVVGTVGAQPSEHNSDEMELRRLRVVQDQRKKGIGKALCLKVIDFARERGYKAVSLETDAVQYAAQNLYEHLGFKKYMVQSWKSRIGKYTTLFIMSYRYNIRA
ncbi:hypothetical protein GDO86_000025 [Hymenochirus boettgeri]|uniref:N-acetyltransferase domain-containing protein n=1 Tax=Hymenochirus boettgeri TaxID=247094 RepID=A0A8T2KFT0_9PIPI|nr:hypothetical protein GDO86_000025 [Hymenochirus boettgeri]